MRPDYKLKPDSEIWIIPVEYYDDFKSDPDLSEREHGGRCSSKINRLLKEPALLDIWSDREPPSDEQNVLKDWFIGVPDREYYIHIDLGKTNDALGFAMGHQEGLKTVIDLAESWDPESHSGDIFFEDVRTRLRVLRDNRGFNILKVSYDSWQCMIGSTRIPVRDSGLKQIKDVIVGDYVYSRKGWRKVIDTYRGYGPTIKIETQHHVSIEATPEHRIEVFDCWIRVGDGKYRPAWKWMQMKDLIEGIIVRYDPIESEWNRDRKPDIIFSTIKSIIVNELYKEVYDLTVDDDPSYVANGFMSHNSYDSIQLLDRIYGFECELFSVDRDMKAYTQWLWALSMGLFDIYNVPKYRREAKDLLIINGKKVDHPAKASTGERGSKDLMDAIAGVTYHCRANAPVHLNGDDFVLG